MAVGLAFATLPVMSAELPADKKACTDGGFVWNGEECCLYVYNNICVTLDNWNKFFGETWKKLSCEAPALYINKDGKPQCCPTGSTPNSETHLCELACKKGFYVPSGGAECQECVKGYTCPGGTFNVIDYSRDQTLVANTYTITYNAGSGGTGSNQTQTVTYNDSFTTKAANTFTKANATFAGWSASSGSYPNASTSYTYTNVGGITLTATWTCNPGYMVSGTDCVAAPAATITLDPGLGTSSTGTSAIYVYGSNYYLNSAHTQQMTTSSNGITIPQRTNYTFTGYRGYCGNSYILMIDSNGKITSDALSCVASIAYDITLTAVWNYSGPTGTYHIMYYNFDNYNTNTSWVQYSNTNSFTIRDAGDAFFGGGVPVTNSSGRTFSGWCAHTYYYLAPGDVYNSLSYGSDLTAMYCVSSGGNAEVNAWVPSVSELISMGYRSNETDARIALCGPSSGLLGATKCNTGYSMNPSTDGNIIDHYVVNGELVRLFTNCLEGAFITSCTACTNKPSNSHYTASSSSLGGNCPWECDTGYTASGNSCVTNTITLNWDENGGNAISNGSCTYGGNLVLPSAPTYSGRTFSGWKTANGAVYNAGATITGGCIDTYTGVTSGTSIVIQAQWDTMSISCDAGQYLPAGATSCASCPGDSYCPNAASYQYNASQAQGATPCPTGYTANTATGKTTESQCAIYCDAGKRISTPGGTCNDSGNGPWVTTAGQTVYYGNVSSVAYCMNGYNTMGRAYHSSIDSCNISVNAGYYVKNVLPEVTAISISSTDDLHLAEIGAYEDYEGRNAVNLVLGASNGTGLPLAIDGQYNRYAVIPAGNRVVWRVYGNNLRSIRIALDRPASNVTISVSSEVNGEVIVFNGAINHSVQRQVNGTAVAPMGELIVLSSAPIKCSAGQYSTASYAYLPRGTSCSNVTAGYYTSGGGTSATPTATGDGCLSDQTCGKCPTGWPNSVAGSNEITDCYSNIKSRAWTGTQTACSNPDTTGCSSATCSSCSNSACDYVAYVNAAGNADGTIRSGCSTNDAACQQGVASLTANTGYHTVSGNLEYCPANTYTVTFGANGGSGAASPTSVTCVYDQDCTLAAKGTLAKTNATFDGWNTATDGSGDGYLESDTVQNLTTTSGATIPLYAVWRTSGCSAGQYLDDGGCVSCPAGYSCAGGDAIPVICAVNKYSTGGATSCSSCTGGLTTSSVEDARYHDEAADCGRVLHIGVHEIRLKSIPSTGALSSLVPSPALRFNYAGNANGRPDFYAKMSTIASPMRVSSTGQISTATSGNKFKTQYNNTNYYVCDDVTCVTE